MLIGATRCGVKCENTVLHETQGPCGSVRKCSADTMTDDTGAHVKGVTPVSLGVTLAGKKTCRGLRDSEPVEGESIRSINRQTSRFKYSAASQERNRTSSNIAGMRSSNFRILQSFLLFLRRSPLSGFGSVARLSSVGFMSKIPVLNVSQRFIQSVRSHSLREAICQHRGHIDPTKIISL